MSIRAIDILRERIVQIQASPVLTATAAAPLIEAKLKGDATTKRGNVPSFGKKGEARITATARGASVIVSGPDWVMQKAQDRGQVDEWIDIVGDCAATEMGGIR